MATKATRARPKDLAELEAVFGPTTGLAAKVLDVIRSEPDRAWQVDEICDEIHEPIVDVVVIVGRLTNGGFVHHDGLGTGYAAARPAAMDRAS